MSFRRLVPALMLGILTPLFGAAPPAASSGVETKALVQGNSKFAYDLYKQLRTREGNLFFSPYSISTALTMTSAGARGKTLEQMTRALHLPAADSLRPMMDALRTDLNARQGKGVRLLTANRVWLQEGMTVLPEFREALGESGLFDKMPFSEKPAISRTMINRWIQDRTENHIAELLPPDGVTRLTRVVVGNAVYFKGDWASKFKKEKTKDASFYAPSGKLSVPFMNQVGPFTKIETASAEILELPYVGDISMVLAIPSDEKKKLSDVEKDLFESNWSAELAKAPKMKMTVHMPRFKIASSLDLPVTLRSLGIEDAFSAAAADFSGIAGTKDLYLSGVYHKSFIDVNEEGSEAAAATGGVISARSRVMFSVDQPFVFLIRDRKTGTILFMGRVTDPRG